ncbi:hypothetical protein RJ640_014021 [Escallonia rubra]|uniref:Retrotransposon gag domain-containing protein n=1 Tax=Escallonia rubra TaxID=112253 RepID=A0AA88R9L0_9ASTE|nr:hypothetical protein RJ640_014021 [Escallonia rubra]
MQDHGYNVGCALRRMFCNLLAGSRASFSLLKRSHHLRPSPQMKYSVILFSVSLQGDPSSRSRSRASLGVLYMAGQRDESTVGQGTQGTDPNLREIIGLVGRIANALESSQNNQQHSQVGESSLVRYAIATDDLTLLERFVKLKPTLFAGGANSDEADEWISNKDKLFERMQLTPSQKVSLATFYLSEDAGFWWKRIDAKWTAVYSGNVRRDRELTFLQLEQKNKTVQEYEKEFTALARHASYLVEGGDRKAKKFETGLNPDIQEAITPLNISDYHEIVDQALNIERTLRFTRAKRAHMSLSRPPVQQWQAGRFPSTSGDRKFLRTDMRSMAYTPRPQTHGFMPRPFIIGPRPQPRPGVRPTQYIPPQQQPVQNMYEKYYDGLFLPNKAKVLFHLSFKVDTSPSRQLIDSPWLKFQKHDTETVDISLLGDFPGIHHLRCTKVRWVWCDSRGNQLCYAKIRDASTVLVCEEDIGWFDVAMGDIIGVEILEASGDFNCNSTPDLPSQL